MNDVKSCNSELSDKIINLANDLKLSAFTDYKHYLEKNLGTEEILYNLLLNESNTKEQSKYKYRLKSAAFPIVKTLNTFEFDSNRLPNLNKDTVFELATCKFIDRKQNVIALGNSGTGKSHIAVALGVEAILKGYTVKFKRASDLVTQMVEAANEKVLSRFIKKINLCQLLIIDELGYLSFDAAGASLLFQIFAARSEVKSTIVTSNLEFSKWTQFLGKEVELSTALISRIVHMSTVLNMNGKDYRLYDTERKKGSAND